MQKSCDRAVKEIVTHLRRPGERLPERPLAQGARPASRRGGVRTPFKHANEVRLNKNQGGAAIELTVFYRSTAAGAFTSSRI